VRDGGPTALHPNPFSAAAADGGAAERALLARTGGPTSVRGPLGTGPLGTGPRSQGVVNLSSHAGEAATRNGREDAGGGAQAGQAFSDLLLLGSTAAKCPLALVTVAAKGGTWSTLAFGADREALEDPDLFAIIAARREPVEVTEPASNPALSRTRLARSNLGIRWLLGVPLIGPTGEVNAIFAVLDTTPRELARRERAAMVATGRLIASALTAHRSPEHLGSSPGPQEPQSGTKPPADTHALLRSHEVAAMFDVTERTVINWAASGKLPCLRTVGGHLRFRSDDVVTLLEANSLRRSLRGALPGSA
jgi:excisionase family DNA binding protein